MALQIVDADGHDSMDRAAELRSLPMESERAVGGRAIPSGCPSPWCRSQQYSAHPPIDRYERNLIDQCRRHPRAVEQPTRSTQSNIWFASKMAILYGRRAIARASRPIPRPEAREFFARDSRAAASLHEHAAHPPSATGREAGAFAIESERRDANDHREPADDFAWSDRLVVRVVVPGRLPFVR